MDSKKVLEMHSVSKSFETPHGLVTVLHNVDLAVREGEFLAITGPSGSGKTTLLNLAALLDTPSTGSVHFDGRDVSQFSESELCTIRKDAMGMVFQKFYLMSHRSALENVMFRFRYMDVSPKEARECSEMALVSVGLGDKLHQAARLLSGGEMQRAAIARAVAVKPRLLVADEPTGNLDRHSADRVMQTFASLNQEGISVLFVSHDESLLRFSSRHLVCSDGAVADFI